MCAITTVSKVNSSVFLVNIPGCVNLSFAYVEGESLLMAMKDIALSSGRLTTSISLLLSLCIHLSLIHPISIDLPSSSLSVSSACTSASLEPSYVLRAIGAEEDLAHSSIRFAYLVL